MYVHYSVCPFLMLISINSISRINRLYSSRFYIFSLVFQLVFPYSLYLSLCLLHSLSVSLTHSLTLSLLLTISHTISYSIWNIFRNRGRPKVEPLEHGRLEYDPDYVFTEGNSDYYEGWPTLHSFFCTVWIVYLGKFAWSDGHACKKLIFIREIWIQDLFLIRLVPSNGKCNLIWFGFG